jgi:O-methyltransferase
MNFDVMNPLRLEFSRKLDELEDEIIGCGCDQCNNQYNCHEYDPQLFRQYGGKVPKTAISMIGKVRLHHLRQCVETVLREGIPGDFIETGVWKGGACVMMRAVLAAYGITDRRVYVADSFCGLPPPNPTLYPADSYGILHTFAGLRISPEEVQGYFARYFPQPDPQVEYLVGWFKDTLPKVETKLSLIRLDGDMYESTMDALVNLYDKVSPGGFIIIDDWGAVEGCRVAVQDFLKERGITPSLIEVTWATVYWRKEA